MNYYVDIDDIANAPARGRSVAFFSVERNPDKDEPITHRCQRLMRINIDHYQYYPQMVRKLILSALVQLESPIIAVINDYSEHVSVQRSIDSDRLEFDIDAILHELGVFTQASHFIAKSRPH